MEKLQDAMNIIDEIINERLVVKPRELSKEEWERYKEVTQKLQDVLLDLEYIEE